MTQLSIDGFISDVHKKTDWMIWNWGPDWTWDRELKSDFNTIHASVDCVLLSRKMAEEGFIAHWTEVAKNSEAQYEFARRITASHKVIFTKTLSTTTWDNASLATGNLMEDINHLKNQSGQDMIAYGGASFASSLIHARVIDEYHLLINPTVLGKGKTIFQEVGSLLNLKLVKAKTYACGMAVLVYKSQN
jgi:dihydrofolate reductase